MSDYLVNSEELTSVANAIRAKSGGSSQLTFPTEFISEIQAIPSGGGGNFALIGTKIFSNLSEYTDTTTWDTHDTEINIKNTDYAWGYVVITCDSAITTSSEWGMTVTFWGRYTSNGSIYVVGNAMQKGSASLSQAAMVTNAGSAGAYGVGVSNNSATVKIQRKCHGTACPKCRAGNYTVKVYGMTGF